MKKSFYSNGKLLISGEYVVLDGALSLAIPTKMGQSLEVFPSERKGIHWKSCSHDETVWYEDQFSIKDIKTQINSEERSIRIQLFKILAAAKKMNPNFLNDEKGFEIKTKLGFPRNWGLGSSSTLINNIARWAEVDAFKLLENSFGGSGYDIASASSNSPILFRKIDNSQAIQHIDLVWNFTNQLFFVYLNRKQDSKEGIERYRNSETKKKTAVGSISEITTKMLDCNSINSFQDLIEEHESIISKIIGLPTIKEAEFADYSGAIKSLGAWGGDFILATGEEPEKDYFLEKGFRTIIPFSEMLK